jgi:hypothetical protein
MPAILFLCLFAVLFAQGCAGGFDHQAKGKNLVVLNRACTAGAAPSRITGLYIVPATEKKLRDNPEIEWGKNWLGKPLECGAFASFYVDTRKRERHDLRVDFEGLDAKGKPRRYFHSSAQLFAKGTVVHVAIGSGKDGSCLWKISTRIDPDFAKKDD